ncbi:MAG: hypothetical protein LBJ02_08585 [Bifidobacteriaceae bacterium]|nr:hypothetical protein [Bifidobacteriaceae bacterium]
MTANSAAPSGVTPGPPRLTLPSSPFGIGSLAPFALGSYQMSIRDGMALEAPALDSPAPVPTPAGYAPAPVPAPAGYAPAPMSGPVGYAPPAYPQQPVHAYPQYAPPPPGWAAPANNPQFRGSPFSYPAQTQIWAQQAHQAARNGPHIPPPPRTNTSRLGAPSPVDPRTGWAGPGNRSGPRPRRRTLSWTVIGWVAFLLAVQILMLLRG